MCGRTRVRRTSYSKQEEFELRLVRLPTERCGALQAPAKGRILPPFFKLCTESEAGPSVWRTERLAASPGGVGFLILGPGHPAAGMGHGRRGEVGLWAHHVAAPAARAGVSEGRGSNTAGVPAPRQTCRKWEPGLGNEALAQRDRSSTACPLPGLFWVVSLALS